MGIRRSLSRPAPRVVRTVSKALVWVRQSQGSDDSVSLELQREKGRALAEELADNVEMCDLGVHTGFSINSPQKTNDDDDRLDANPKVRDAKQRLEDGEFDYLVAYDATRLSRDGYKENLKTSCALGECEMAFVDEEDDEFARDIRHRAEQEAKQNEIEKARQAVKRRQEKGHYQGGIPFGLRLDERGEFLVPDGEDFDTVQDVFREAGSRTYREIAEGRPFSHATVGNILDRRELYEEAAERASVDFDS